MKALKGGNKMEILPSGIEVDAAKFAELSRMNHNTHCCQPTGCLGQPGDCGYYHLSGLKVRKD
jgi:hypothetical protein